MWSRQKLPQCYGGQDARLVPLRHIVSGSKVAEVHYNVISQGEGVIPHLQSYHVVGAYDIVQKSEISAELPLLRLLDHPVSAYVLL